MALFQRVGTNLTLVKPANFGNEKDLQTLIEKNLQTVFNCRLVATEFPTGLSHSGRIDTLAISEENNPVIVEYKKVESSELINQSLYYLAWIQDHRGDFQVKVNEKFGKTVVVDWSGVRVICIAPGYKKYDLHAVTMMGANIELWQYRLFANGAFYLEQVYGNAGLIVDSALSTGKPKNPIMVAAGKKAALTKATGEYTFEEHLDGVDENIKLLIRDLQEFTLALGSSVTEVPKKMYVAYKITQNFVCVEIRKTKIFLYLKLNPSEIKDKPKNSRNVTTIGHYGTGDFEIAISSKEQLESAYPFIRLAFENVGGS